MKDLDPIIVTRQVPAIHIFLTLDNIDPKTPGYQKAKCPTNFWPEPSQKQPKRDEDYAYKNRKSNGSKNSYSQRQSNHNNRPQKKQGPSGSNNNSKRPNKKKDEANNQPEPGTSSQLQESAKS